MTRRGLVIHRPFELVLYPAFEQSFFIDPTVLLLFRGAAHTRRLHSVLNGRTVPYKNPDRARRVVGTVSWSRECGVHHETLAGCQGSGGTSRLASAQGALAAIDGQPWTR